MNRADLKIKAFFDEKADSWDESCRHDEKKLDIIINLAAIKPGYKVLDIACGTGVLFSRILSYNPSTLTGIDLSEKMIEIARKKHHDHRLKLMADNFFNCKSGDIDTAIIYSAYPHFLNKQKLATHLAAVLKPKGRFIIAHSQSKEEINLKHINIPADISTKLKPAGIESKIFESLFAIDILIDTSELYIISGQKL